MIVRKRRKTFHIDWLKGQVRVRGSLGTRSEDAAHRLKSRLETAVAEGPKSPTWMELVDVLPAPIYTGFANALGIKQTKPHTWDDLSRSLRDDMALRVKLGTFSPKTQARYEFVIREFEHFWEEREPKFWLLRDLEENRAWVKEFKFWRVKRIEENSGTGKGIQMDLAVLHTIFEHATEQDWMKKNPVRVNYERNENPEGGADPFTPGQLARFRQHLDEDEMSFLLLRHTGLREGDAVSARFQNVDFATREVDIVTQKRHKRVILPVHPELMLALKRERDRRNAQPGDTILINPNTGSPFSEKALYYHIVALGKRSGVANARPHQFRDSFAADLFLNGASTPDVAQALGDTEEVIGKHYAKWIPARRERLRGFVENGPGLEGYGSFAPLDGLAVEVQQRQAQQRETLVEQSPLTNEVTVATVRGPNVIEIASEKNQQDEQCSAVVVLPDSGKKCKAGIESFSAVDRSKANATSCAEVLIHGTSSRYNHGCRCERCAGHHSKLAKAYRDRLKREGRGSGAMVMLICNGCGIQFERKKGNRPDVKGFSNAYHSRSCYAAAKRGSGVVVHGTRTAYDQYGCRCEPCRAASSEHMKKYRARLKAEGREPMVTLTCAECGKEFLRRRGNSPAAKGTVNAYCSKTCYRKAAAKRRGGVVVHGTRTAYDRHGCRCEPCRAVHSEHMKKCSAATAKRKTAVVVRGASGGFDQQQPCQGTDYEGHVPAQAIPREVINEQSCA